jgi:putative transposase
MSMIHLLILAVHLLATIAKLVRPGGVRTVVAESLVLKQQLLISSRSRRRAPNLNSFDRFVLGLGSLFVTPSRIGLLRACCVCCVINYWFRINSVF